MGPSRKDKFYFLLEQLRSLPESELSSLDLVIASKINDVAELKMAVDYKGQLLSLAQSLHRLRYYPGYSAAYYLKRNPLGSYPTAMGR